MLGSKIFIFEATKIIWADLSISQDDLYKKIPFATLCKFWHRT
jgi:hypothetical protein